MSKKEPDSTSSKNKNLIDLSLSKEGFNIENKMIEESSKEFLSTQETLPSQEIANTLEVEKFKRFNVEDIYRIIEKALPRDNSLKNNLLPHPRNWLGARFLSIWVLPIILINKSRKLISSINPIREYSEDVYSIKKSETIYTATKEVFEGNSTMRFFGPRFLTIWVLPLAITGAVMEFLFISPITGIKPFS